MHNPLQQQKIDVARQAHEESIPRLYVVHLLHYFCFLYSTFFKKKQEVMLQLQKYVEPVMVQHNVTLGLYGHNHVYQRHCASYQSQCMQRSDENTVSSRAPRNNHRRFLPLFLFTPVTDRIRIRSVIAQVHWYPSYPVNLVAGTAGAHFTMNANFTHPADFTELVFYEYGYGRLTAYNATHLGWDFVSSINGTILDSMMIVQVFRQRYCQSRNHLHIHILLFANTASRSAQNYSDFSCPNDSPPYIRTCSELGTCESPQLCKPPKAGGISIGVVVTLVSVICLTAVAAGLAMTYLMRNSKNKETYEKVSGIELG